MNITLREFEKLILKSRIDGELFTDSYMETTHYMYTGKPMTCGYCSKLTEKDAPYLLSTKTKDGVAVVKCEECINIELSQLLGESILVYTKPKVERSLAQIKQLVDITARSIRDLGKKSNTEANIVKRYTDKLDRIHRGVVYVVKSQTAHKCSICKCEIPVNGSYFNSKKRSLKRANLYNIKVCIECYQNSVQTAIDYNIKIYDRALIEISAE